MEIDQAKITEADAGAHSLNVKVRDENYASSRAQNLYEIKIEIEYEKFEK